MGRHDGNTAVAEPPGNPPPPATGMSVGDRIRFVLRGIGQTLITGGVVVLLFVVYEVYVTNYFADRAQHRVQMKFDHIVAEGGNDPLALPKTQLDNLPTGTGIANLYIPRLGADYAWTIVQGTSQADLGEGPGHYTFSALPGQIGNFAVAGHRVGKGEPFLNLDHLRPGDAVIVQTVSHWYVYRVKGDVQDGNLGVKGADGIPGREIVTPGDGNPLYPVPDHPGAKATEKLMTMTTCHPKFTAAKRMIVYADLQEVLPSEGKQRPSQISSLYSAVSN